MSTEIINAILACVTHDREKVSYGMAPIFYTSDKEESERVAFYIAKVTTGMVHYLENDVYIVIKH